VFKRGRSPSYFFFPLPLRGRGIKGDGVNKQTLTPGAVNCSSDICVAIIAVYGFHRKTSPLTKSYLAKKQVMRKELKRV